jgi:uncharacterized protein (DUF983 family)
MIGTKSKHRRTCPACNRFMSVYVTGERDVCSFCGTEVDHSDENVWASSADSAILEWAITGKELPVSGDARPTGHMVGSESR